MYHNSEKILPFASLPYYSSSSLGSSSVFATKSVQDKISSPKVTHSTEEKRTKKEIITTLTTTESISTTTIPIISEYSVVSTTTPKNITTKTPLQYDSLPSKVELKLKLVNDEAKRNSIQKANEYFETNVKFENKRPCVDFDPCKHGKCMLSNDTGEFKCQCDVGYMGPFCDLIRHPCDFRPCENGICEIVGDLYYKCLCKPMYTGVNCHIGEKCVFIRLVDSAFECLKF